MISEVTIHRRAIPLSMRCVDMELQFGIYESCDHVLIVVTMGSMQEVVLSDESSECDSGWSKAIKVHPGHYEVFLKGNRERRIMDLKIG